MTQIGRIDYESMDDKVKLDKKDRRILSLLSENARIPLTQICKKIGLSRDAVDYRIKRLQKEGIILSFFPNLNYSKMGFYIFHVFLLVDETNKENIEDLLEYLKDHSHVVSVIEYTDRWDFEVLIIAKNLLDFDSTILDIVSKFPDIILEKDKLEIIKRYNSNYVPPLLREEDHEKIMTFETPEPASFDQTDLKILRLLSEDCRTSTYKIGKDLKISPDTVRYRIKNMIEQNIIRNFTILINLSKMNYHWYTYSMEMKMFDRTNEKKFEQFLQKNENILRSAKTLGGWDLFMYLIVKNPSEFHKIVKDLKNVFSTVIRNYQTWVAYKEHIFKSMPEVIDQK